MKKACFERPHCIYDNPFSIRQIICFILLQAFKFLGLLPSLNKCQKHRRSLSVFMNSETPAKKIRLNMKIGTHNGAFHCDEALAVWMLKQLDEYKDAEVIRTRKPELLAECDIVVDVGAVFDHKLLRYDHHQREFKESYHSLDPSKPWTTKLSSAGLIYVHYGKQVIRAVMEKIAKEKEDNSEIPESVVALISDKVYENLIEEIDAVDNGISVSDDVPRYKITTTLSRRVGNLNPSWNEDNSDEIAMKRFLQAVNLVSVDFVDRVSYYQLSWLPAHSFVKDAVEKR